MRVLVALAAIAPAAGCTQPHESDGSESAGGDTASARRTETPVASQAPTASPAQDPTQPPPSESAAAPASPALANQARPAPPAGTSPSAPPAPPAAAPPPDPASPTSPASGSLDADQPFHLDDADVEYELPRRPSRPRKGRTVQIMLRSSPPGAVAAVDGVTVGPTPALWEGVVDTTPREFTFVLAGYAIARYRFVPTRSGIVHGTLEPIKPEGGDAAQGGKRGRDRERTRPRGEPAPN